MTLFFFWFYFVSLMMVQNHSQVMECFDIRFQILIVYIVVVVFVIVTEIDSFCYNI